MFNTKLFMHLSKANLDVKIFFEHHSWSNPVQIFKSIIVIKIIIAYTKIRKICSLPKLHIKHSIERGCLVGKVISF